MDNLSFKVPTLEFSNIRVSTITTTAQLGCKIDLDELYKQLVIIPYWDLTDGVLKMDYKGTGRGTCFKDLMQKPKGKKSSFFNQATLVIRVEVSPLNWKEINIKIFRNGGVQMTGVRSFEMAKYALRWLVTHILETYTGIFKDDTGNPKEPNIHKEETQLINTDFSIGAKVRREQLHKILVEQYGLNSSYESAIYQGVKTKYFYNAKRPDGKPPGICPCPTLCKGTGDGSKIGACKKITISPFQTGNGIITGARDMCQIYEAYDFMKMVFTRHADTILRKIYVCPNLSNDEVKPEKPHKNTWIQHPCPRNIVHIA